MVHLKQPQPLLVLPQLQVALAEQPQGSLLLLAFLGWDFSEVVLVAVAVRTLLQLLVRLVVLVVLPVAVAVAVPLPTTALPLVLVVLAVQALLTLSPIANPMITDSHNIIWTPSEDRSLWTSSEGLRLLINPAANDEQVLSSIEQTYAPAPVIKTDEDRIAELEAQVKALLAKLS